MLSAFKVAVVDIRRTDSVDLAGVGRLAKDVVCASLTAVIGSMIRGRTSSARPAANASDAL